MFTKAIESITQSIFPIFFTVVQGNKTVIGVSGTGFFIDDNGLFITAYHVINDIPAGAKLLYCGNVPHSIIRALEIESIRFDAKKDIFVGRVPKEYKLPKIKPAEDEPKVGQSLCLCGYPLAQLSQNKDGSINVNNVRKYWQPTFMIDGFQGNINGKLYKGFITQHTSLKGMSGGPIFGLDGQVYGMDVATMSRQIHDPSAPMTIANGIGLGINYIKENIKHLCST